MNQTFLKHKSYFLYNELARLQICKRWVLLGKSITYKCLLCQSVFCRVLNGVSDSVFKFKKSFKKDTEKVVLLQMKGLMQIIVKFSTDFFCVCVCVCVHVSITKYKLNVYFSLKGNKLVCFANSQSHFR